MANTIDIIINAAWRGGAAVKDAGEDLRDLGNRAAASGKEIAGGLAKSLPSFLSVLGTIAQASVVIGTVGFVVGQVTQKLSELYGKIEEGAQLEILEQRFDIIARNAGTTGEALEGQLEPAIGHLVDRLTGMGIATDFLAQNVAKTGEEAVELTRIAVQLGIDIQDIQNVLEDLSTEGFSAIGLAVGDFEIHLRRLQDEGYELEDAFKLAFIETANDQIEMFGDRSETTAGRLAILRDAWGETGEALKRGLSDAVNPLITGFTDILIAVDDAAEAVDRLADNISDLENQKEAVDEVKAAIEELGTFLGAPGKPWAAGSTAELQSELLDLAVLLAQNGDTFQEQKNILAGFGFEVDDIGFKLGDLGASWIQFNQRLKESELEQLTRQLDIIEQQRFSFDNWGDVPLLEWDELLIKLGYVDEETGRITDKFRDLQDAVEAASEAFGIDFGPLDVSGSILNETSLAGIRSAITTQVGLGINRAFEEAQQVRLDLWLDFQGDLTTISTREAEERTRLEERYEERRTDIVEDYERQREQIEEREAQNIARIREDSARRQEDILQDGYESLQELEEDHADRMAEIIENAELQLKEAAGRLDAAAVARIERQRDDALQDEQDAYQDQRRDILRTVERRLQEEQEAAELRIEREQENNAIRLQEMEEAHQRELDELKEAHDDRLVEIAQQAQEERQARQDQYISERTQLDNHWRAKSAQETYWMNTILQQEAQFWQQRLNMVGGSTVDIEPIVGPTGYPTGDDTGGGTEETPPNRGWLIDTAVRIAMSQDPTPTTAEALNWSRYFHDLTDAQIAAWIEDHSDMDVPYYGIGGRVTASGLALVGERGPELLDLPLGTQIRGPAVTQNYMNSKGGVNIKELNVIVNESENPSDTASEVREELEKFFGSLI